MSSNWEQLRKKVQPSGQRKRKRAVPEVRTDAHGVANGRPSNAQGKVPGSEKQLSQPKPQQDILRVMEGGTGGRENETGHYLAIDCEMVGVGAGGADSILARVSIVNFYGSVVLDAYVKPEQDVTDYRTWVSGIRPGDLADAPSFKEVQSQVAEVLKGRVLVGHSIMNDMRVLLLDHPRHLVRDTANYAPFHALCNTKRPALKTLVKLVLGLDIQEKAHSSVIDARATMGLYRSQKKAWENALRTHSPAVLDTTTTEALASIDTRNLKIPSNSKDRAQRRHAAAGVASTLQYIQDELRTSDIAQTAKEQVEKIKTQTEKQNSDDLFIGVTFDDEESPPTSVDAPAPPPKKKAKKGTTKQKAHISKARTASSSDWIDDF